MTELVDLPSAPRLLTNTKQVIKPVLIFLVSTALFLASRISVQGWKYSYSFVLGVQLEDNSWMKALFRFVGESFVLSSTLCYFQSHFPGDEAEGVGGLGFLFGYFILPNYRDTSSTVVDVFGVYLNRGKVLPIVVLVWALWMELKKYYRKDMNRRVVDTGKVIS